LRYFDTAPSSATFHIMFYELITSSTQIALFKIRKYLQKQITEYKIIKQPFKKSLPH